MSKCKYYLEKEVVSYDGGITWNETGVTRKGNLYEESSEDCTDPSVQYRWINMDVTTDYICDGTNKYYKQKKQVSYDGIIWQDVTPAEYQRGSIYEVNSPDCQPTYRWVNLDISTDYICDGTTKYYKQKKQVSYGGQEWEDVIPYEYQRGDVYETQSTDCGYVVLPKFQATYSGGQTYEKECDGNTTLTTGDTRPSGYEYSAMTTAIIGNCVTSVDSFAFLGCTSLESVTIGNGVTSIEINTFADCTSLESVTIGNGVTSIGTQAFYNCSSLTGVTIPNSVTSIGMNAFVNCTSLESVTIPDSVTSIGNGAFELCTDLTSVNIPSGVTSIGGAVFSRCKSLTSIIIPDSVTSIGNGAFQVCSGLTSVTIPNSVTTISDNAFHSCSSLTSINFPNSVTSIGGSAFNSCTGLTSCTIGDSITSIGQYAFYNCNGLASVIINSMTPPTLGSNAFAYTNNCPIYVPASSLETYKSASGWSSYASRIQAIP